MVPETQPKNKMSFPAITALKDVSTLDSDSTFSTSASFKKIYTNLEDSSYCTIVFATNSYDSSSCMNGLPKHMSDSLSFRNISPNNISDYVYCTSFNPSLILPLLTKLSSSSCTISTTNPYFSSFTDFLT